LTGSLHVNSSADSYFIGGGNVGIGTATPAVLLHVDDGNYSTPTGGQGGDIIFSDMDGYSEISILGSTTHGGIISFGDSTDYDYGQITQFASSAGEGGRMRFIAGATETMNLRGGLVGIGTATPGAELHVVGDALITGTVTAQEFHAEFVSSSIIYESGSTLFGDTMDDVHWRTGSMYITGSDHHFFGSVGMGTTDPNVVGSVTLTTGTQLHLKDTYARLILDGTTASEIHLADLGYTADSRQFRIRAINDTLTIASATDNFGTITDTLTVDHAGNVGIRQPAPSQMLHIGDGSDAERGIMLIEGAEGAHLLFAETSAASLSGSLAIRPAVNTAFVVQEDGSSTPLFVIHPNGNVGIGTTNPSSKLQIYDNSDATVWSSTITNVSTGTSARVGLTVGNSANSVRFGMAGTAYTGVSG
jgi:hypothetical protein